MARPETKPGIKIGELTFQPVQRSFWQAVKASLSEYALELCVDLLYSDDVQYRPVVASLRIAHFYGSEAADAFDAVTTPQVRSTTELQLLRQMNSRNPVALGGFHRIG